MSISSISNSQNALIDHKSKLVLFWTPRAACTTAVSMFYKNMGLFDDVIKSYPLIHDYRGTFYKNYGTINQQILDNKSYLKIKLVRDPYKRAVSNYQVLVNQFKQNKTNQNISFKEYLIKVKANFNFNPAINYHSIKQYDNKDKFVNKIIKVENIVEELTEIDKIHNTNLKQSYD